MKNVLVADDSIVTQKMIQNFIADSPLSTAKVVEASDGVQALRAYKDGQFDMVLSDWNMPNMNGLEFIKALRQYEQEHQLTKAPIIMITTEGTKSKMNEAIEAGANGYITKPFSKEALLDVLKQHLSA